VLLALDAGNTNITIGIFEGRKLTARWRLRTVHEQTADEWGILLRNLFALNSIDLAAIDGVIIASVVPPLDSNLAAMSERYFHRAPMFVNSETDTGIKIRYDIPQQVGADRIVNAVAASLKYGGPCVVVDLGTAITFDVVSQDSEYLGGIICPGIGIAIAGLFSKTANLPMVDFRAPERLIGTNTVGAIQSGLYYGSIGMIDGILEHLIAELGPKTSTVATGGQAELIIRGSRFVKVMNADLTLQGLQIIWERNNLR
jgi:type III pantothenate kinase